MQNGLQVKIFEAGSCVHPGFVVKPGSGIKPRVFPAGVGLISHPTQGYVLFDTGYHNCFFKSTRSFPERFYAWTTPCHYHEENGIVFQLAKENITIEQIDHLVLSHFHADHIAAVGEFRSSVIHCARLGFNAIKTSGRLNGIRKGYLPTLLPNNVEQQLQFHDQYPIPIAAIFPELLNVDLYCKDLFDDGLIYTINLPGHAAGQIGLLVRLTNRWICLLADACWLIDSLRDGVNQHWIANILCDDMRAYRHTLQQLRGFYQQVGDDVQFVPSHCSETLSLLTARGWMQ